ncbi:carboxymuconolactone decarboxylase family protein [Promethearchaeum syntrophicum]|uniref:Carboxymuconolactone decarboxylase family protein n=1 Tax=Promethearchaeum syntrophicum TaxID=2594042 RepID=A0A5B9D6E3_9ARCH|nr:carboxymuconolactone decarboxylase family protein [Candidatus Prometheoarchaeum syntrophicum]QEE14575.1 Carboxymuconolactone decarboxylase family protein [Candidatus Prometheoarchaeum syntrophicum]
MQDTMEKLGDIQNLMQRVGKEDPSWMNSFQSFLKATKKDGALSSKMKEIIGLAVSVKAQCERCIPWHVKNALDLGATKAEIIEAAQVAVVLGGGPSLMYMKNVYDALDTLSK